MSPICGFLLTLALLLSSISNVTVTPGVLRGTPNGYVVSNFDPLLNSTYNDEIYDANFLPGFSSGLTNTTVSWKSGNGYGNIQYSVGPWAYAETTSIPHLAVGPQCCNFVEVPHTQQFRRVEWGDYYYVRAGFGSPGVNVENYTAVFGGQAVDVGLRTDRDWVVQFSADWGSPTLLKLSNEWGTIGIAVTQYVPNAPGNLVYTLMELWMDANSSSHLVQSSNGVVRNVVSSDVVVYHPLQFAGVGNQTITLDLSPYLDDTLRTLGLQNLVSKPPVISYVYLNVEGYNFAWNSTLWSFKLMSPLTSSNSFASFLVPAGVAIVAVASVVSFLALRRRSQHKARKYWGTIMEGAWTCPTFFGDGVDPMLLASKASRIIVVDTMNTPYQIDGARTVPLGEDSSGIGYVANGLRIVGCLGGWEKLKNSRGRFDSETRLFSADSFQLYSMKCTSERWLMRLSETIFSRL